MVTEPKRQRFSMIRDFALADVITLANGFCGMGSVLASARYLESKERAFLWLAFGLLPFSALFDFLDGRVARWRHRSTALGAQLDSLSDLISFGVAPAMLAFAVGMRGGWDALVLVYFVGCGLSRLARYNVTQAELADETGKVKYFEGTPIPTSMLLVALLAVLTGLDRIGPSLPWGSLRVLWELHWLVLVYALSGTLMISKTLHIPKP